ncbi:hypothetical protein DDP38_06220 [Helicobacter pylori]|nr:hypothetical protein DDP38_06220 [Helicobacter pylori]RKU96010.1 hypothetical protein DDP34_06255 [Helicobacter pylori]
MKENLALIFNPYPLNFELSLDQNQHPPLEKKQTLQKRVFKFAERVFSLSIARKPLQYPRL